MKKFITTIGLSCLLVFASACAQASMIMQMYVVDAGKFATIEKDGAQRRALLSETNSTRMLDIEKAWNGLDFLLTRTNNTSPRSWVIFGRKQVGEDIGYGPAGLLSPSDVKEVAKLLKDETPEKLASQYDAQEMDRQKIYPRVWVREGKQGLDWLLGYYRELVLFYENAAKNGQGIMIVVL